MPPRPPGLRACGGVEDQPQEVVLPGDHESTDLLNNLLLSPDLYNPLGVQVVDEGTEIVAKRLELRVKCQLNVGLVQAVLCVQTIAKETRSTMEESVLLR